MRGGAVPDVRIANNLLYLPTETSNTNDGTPILNAAFALAIAFVFCALCCYIRSFESSDLDRCTENMSESAQLLLSEWVESYEMKVRTNKPLSLCYPFAQHRMIVIEACPLSLESQVWHVRSICNTFITRPAAGLDRSTTLLATCEILSGGIPWRFGACTASRPPHRYHSAECHADDDGSPVRLGNGMLLRSYCVSGVTLIHPLRLRGRVQPVPGLHRQIASGLTAHCWDATGAVPTQPLHSLR